MNTMIQQPPDPNDVSKLFIQTDLELWKEETQIIEKETALFINLLSVKLVELSKSRNANFKILFDEIDFFKDSNPELQEKISSYRLKLDVINECEDLQCEKHFITTHKLLKNDVEKHLARYRQLKKNILDALYLYT